MNCEKELRYLCKWLAILVVSCYNISPMAYSSHPTYKRRLEANLCIRCGLVPPKPKLQKCENCIQVCKIRCKNTKFKNKDKYKTVKSEAYQKKKEWGMDNNICIQCFKNSVDGKFLRCDRCRIGRKRQRLRKLYGVTLEQYDALAAKQNNLCAICGKPQPGYEDGEPKLLCVDHDHSTKKIRGLLCYKCNCGIGMLCDNITLLQEAVEYLKRYQ